MDRDEVPRSSGRFNLDRVAQKHMIERLEVWIPPEPVPSVRGLDTEPIRPLLEVTLPGYIIGCSRGLATRRATSHLERPSSQECNNREL